MQWRRGIEGQRRADLGDGTYLNPVSAGDHPDPTLLRDVDDYYQTFSSFDAHHGVVIWHSRDIVNWQRVGPALHRPIGSVWAFDVCRHDGRYYVYIPARTAARRSIYLIHADSIGGPLSDTIDSDLPDHIDLRHAVGEDGEGCLYLGGGDRAVSGGWRITVTRTHCGHWAVGPCSSRSTGRRTAGRWQQVETFPGRLRCRRRAKEPGSTAPRARRRRPAALLQTSAVLWRRVRLAGLRDAPLRPRATK